jgi:Na+-driven multidrug efflux pump
MIPSIIMLVAVAVNIVLDPLLIFGIGPFPRMELKGAALATLCARATTMVASLLILRFRFDMLTARLPSQRQLLESWKNTLHIAAPAALTQVLIPLSLMAITRLVAFYGSAAVAAFGISMRLEMFVLSPLMALGAVLVPFVGQNAGAGRPDRIMGGMRFSYGFSLLIGAVIFIVMGLFGRQVAAIFNPDPVVIRIVYRYLLILSLSYGFQGSVLLTASYFNAMRRPANAMAITLLRTILLYVPLAWIGSHFLELVGVFTGAAFSSVLAGIAGILWVRREVRSEW